MSYKIIIKANEGSFALFTEGEVPDGEHVITGEDDGDNVSTEVERRSDIGRVVNRARAHYSRREMAHGLGAPVHQVSHNDADR